MGWYDAVGRPVFSAVPPEAAHRLAAGLLSLPLPWSHIGGAARDPSLEVDLAGVRLSNPVGLAAGFDKTCRHVDALGSLGFGYVVAGTITRAARAGNPKPRIVRYPRRASMTNAMGLPNPGAHAAAANLARARRTAPTFVSIADEAVEDALACAAVIEPHTDGFELNASCPNVSWGRDRDQEVHLRDLVSALRSRSERPLFVKLPPFRPGIEREVVLALAAIARESGADGFVCGNTRSVRDERLAVGAGGVSGRALWGRTADSVSDVHRAVGGPVVASGGIFDATDANECLAAGAAAVQIYTSFVLRGPGVIGAITHGLSRSETGDASDARAMPPAGVSEHRTGPGPAGAATVAG